MAQVIGTDAGDIIDLGYVSNGVSGGFPGDSDDLIQSGGGDDNIASGLGRDTIEGGAGQDWFRADYGTITQSITFTLQPGAGVPSVFIGQGTTVTDIERFSVTTGSGGDALAFGDANDRADGGAGTDSITGGGGNDNLYGGSGDDVLSGQGGDDSLGGGTGDNTLDGGAGSDTVFYTDRPRGVSIDLSSPLPKVTAGGTDTYISIENVIGGFGNDVIIGDSHANILGGGPTGAPDSRLEFGNDNVSGGGGNDTILANIGSDTLDGGDGIDTLSFETFNSQGSSVYAITVNLNVVSQEVLYATTQSISNFENVIGGYQNDSLTGDAGANTLDGFEGNDSLVGGAGDDTLIGGAGADILEGGTGTDIALYDYAGSASIGQNFGSFGWSIGSGGSDTLRDMEFARFTNGTLNLTTGAFVQTSFAITPLQASRSEGDLGATPFTFTVTRSGDTALATSVAWAATGSGTNAADAEDFDGSALPAGVVSFAAGETSRTITVNVRGDTALETDEGFKVTLTSNGATGLITGAPAQATILSEDLPDPDPVLSIAPVAAALAEGQAGSTSFTFTVTRSGNTSGASSAAWTVSGNEADAADFTGNALPPARSASPPARPARASPSRSRVTPALKRMRASRSRSPARSAPAWPLVRRPRRPSSAMMTPC